jgi:hypothetical protein
VKQALLIRFRSSGELLSLPVLGRYCECFRTQAEDNDVGAKRPTSETLHSGCERELMTAEVVE